MKFIGNDSSLWLVDFGGSEEILVRGESLVCRVAEKRVDVQGFAFSRLDLEGNLARGSRGGRAVEEHQRVGTCRTDHYGVQDV